MAPSSFLLLPFLLFSVTEAQWQKTMRVVTWNVADNDGMNGGFDKTAVRQILGLEQIGPQRFLSYFDIYAITLQENCHLCDKQQFSNLAAIFVNELNRGGRFVYEEVGHTATRVAGNCRSVSCLFGMHGSTHMIVIAKRGMAIRRAEFHKNKCTGGWPKNSEKGIAMVKFQVRGTHETVCVGGLHLDSSEADERRECFEDFTHDHDKHLSECTQIFYAGDFNTRTGDKGGPEGYANLNLTDVLRLRPLDEMNGAHPYGGQQLMSYISEQSDLEFKEGQLDFFPTYSLKPPSNCEGVVPCYRANRPPSWTDRIICSGCNLFWYNSLPIYLTDHAPVIGIFTL